MGYSLTFWKTNGDDDRRGKFFDATEHNLLDSILARFLFHVVRDCRNYLYLHVSWSYRKRLDIATVVLLHMVTSLFASPKSKLSLSLKKRS